MKKIIFLLFVFLLASCEKKEVLHTNGTDGEILLTIYSHNGKSESDFLIKSFGHTFLAIKNNTSSNLDFYGYTLAPNDEISFSAWGIDDHWGVWYDIEAHYQEYYGRYKGIISLSIGLEKEKLSIINDFIKTHNEWTFFHNCTYFSTRLWNKVCDKNEKLPTYLISSPTKLYKAIKKYEEKEFNRKLIVHDYTFYYRQGPVNYRLEAELND